MLLASSTTEGRGGGDLRKSVCAVERTGSRITLTKSATVMSYGAQADAILTTARRSADAAPSDQVLVAFMKEDYQLEPIMNWDTLGMRGTCSSGFTLKGNGGMDQVLPDRLRKDSIAYDDACRTFDLGRSMVPGWPLPQLSVRDVVSAPQLAAERPDAVGAAHLTRATDVASRLRGTLASALQRFRDGWTRGHELESLEFQTAMNLLKVSASEMATSTVMSAMQACGLSGYRNDGEFSVSRHLRDVLSSSIMINNERILGQRRDRVIADRSAALIAGLDTMADGSNRSSTRCCKGEITVLIGRCSKMSWTR